MMTEKEALAEIEKTNSIDEIRKIIHQTDFVDHKAADNAIYVFYQASMSPDKNDPVWKYLEQVQVESNGQIRILNGSTDVVNLLYNNDVRETGKIEPQTQNISAISALLDPATALITRMNSNSELANNMV